MQVFLGLQDFSQYSSWSQQCRHLNDRDSSSDFQLFQYFYQSFGDSSEHTYENWYHRHQHVAQIFLVLWQGPSIFLSFHFLLISLCSLLKWQNHSDMLSLAFLSLLFCLFVFFFCFCFCFCFFFLFFIFQ